MACRAGLALDAIRRRGRSRWGVPPLVGEAVEGSVPGVLCFLPYPKVLRSSLPGASAREGGSQYFGIRKEAQDARDTSLNGLSDQGRNPPTAPSPPTDSIQGKSGPTGQRHLQGMPVPGAPEDTYLRSQDTYPHHLSLIHI